MALDVTQDRICPSAEELACLVEGALDKDDVAEIMSHVGDCEACSEILAQLARSRHDGFPDDDDFELEQGATLDRYVLIEPIGQGAMGVVWSAYDPGLQRKLAIKLVAADAITSDKRLQREAQTMARLSHPNVVTVHAVGVVGDRLFIAMDLVEGGTLGDWLAAAPRSVDEIVACFIAAGRGLAHAHAHGIVHRDFKPHNVLCGRDGRVCVMDFGLAQAPVRDDDTPSNLASTEPDLARLTRTGAFIGTPAYMAPEQFSGRPCDARSDQFSFCVALWEALYGVRPFGGRSFDELAMAVKTGTIRAPPAGRAVPARLERAIRRGLCIDRSARWPDMPALLAALSPRRGLSTRTFAIAGLTTVLAGAGLWWAVRADAKPCTAAAGHLDGVWDDDRRAALRQALLGSGAGFGEVTARETFARLDEHANAWVRMHTEVCNSADDALLDRRMACLDRRRAELAATVEVLTSVDTSATENAVLTVAKLRPVSVCGDAAAMQVEQPVPEDPVVATKVAEQLDALARARAWSRAGASEQAEAGVAQVVEAAAELEWAPLTAEALLLRAQLRHRRGDYDREYDDLQQAWELALSSGHDKVVALAATLQVELATKTYALDDGLTWAGHALAAGERVGHDPSIEAGAHAAVGLLRTFRGEFDEAERMLERALELYASATVVDETDIAMTEGRFGMLALSRQDLDEAIVHFSRAIELYEANLGATHPLLVAPVLNLGVAHYTRFELEEAERLFHRALAIQEASLPGPHPDLVTILTNLGNVETSRVRYLEALAFYQRAHDMAVQLLGPDDVQVGVALVNVGMIRHELQQYEEARAAYERTLDIWERTAVAHPALAHPLTGLGTSLVDLGRADDALPHLERAFAIRSSAPTTPRDMADTEHHLARALWDTGGDRTRATALAESARKRLVPLGEIADEPIREIDDWLAGHHDR